MYSKIAQQLFHSRRIYLGVMVTERYKQALDLLLETERDTCYVRLRLRLSSVGL
jgi:hypothetical protein